MDRASGCHIAGNAARQEQGIGAIRTSGGWRVDGVVTLIGDATIGGNGNVSGAIAGKITGPFALNLCSAGTVNGTISISNPSNDWTGTTTIQGRTEQNSGANTFISGGSEIIPNGLGKGNVIIAAGATGGTITWNLNGFSETINGLLSSGIASGCIILNNLAATFSVLTVGDNDQSGTFGGVIRDNGGNVALTKMGGGRQTLTGANTYTGTTTVSNGTLAVSGSGSIASSLHLVVSGGTLDVSEVTGGFTYGFPLDVTNGTLAVRNTTSPGVSALSLTDSRVRVASLGAAPIVVETAALSTGGLTNLIDIASIGAIAAYPATFTMIKYSGAIGGAGFNFGLGHVPTPSTTGYVTNNELNSSVDLVLLSGPKPLTWTGTFSSDWDINTTSNWLAFGTTPSVYLDVDSVRFTDAAAAHTVNLTTTLQPGAVAVSNEVMNYTFNGAGNLSGPTGLTKDGAGTLVLDNSGVNDFFGPMAINAGTLQVGNNDANGSLGLGSVANGSALTFARSDAATVANAISGAGTLTQNGSGVLTLSGDSTFTGPAVVAQGTLKTGSALALGAVDGGTTVNPGATLDVNGQNLGAEPVTASGAGIGGNGAIINSGAGQNNALRFLTLAGNAVFGGTARWDIRQAGGSATLNGAFKITKVGSNQVSLVGLTAVDAALGDIDIQQGTFSVETTTVQLGDAMATLTVHGNALLNLFNLNPNPLNKVIVLQDGATVRNENGISALNGAVTLEANATFNAANAGTTPMLTCNGRLGGPGNLLKIGSGPMTLNGPHDFTGATLLSNGTLFVDGTLAQPSSVTVSGGTLAGVGIIGGPVTIATNGTLAPGNGTTAIAVLEIDNAVTLSGTTVMDLNKSASPLPSDFLAFLTTLTYGGTLRLNIAGPALAAGDEFALFNFQSASGAFATLNPATPGPSLVWDTSQLTLSGILRVISAPPPHISSIVPAGTNVVISGNLGTPATSYYVLTSPEVTLPRMLWLPIATNLFDNSGNFSFTNAVDPTTPQRFFLLQLP